MSNRCVARANRAGKFRKVGGFQIVTLLCATAGALTAAPVAAFGGGPVCELLPNGSFDEFFTGWTLVPTVHATGDAFNNDTSGIIDGTGYQLQDGTFLDSHVLALSLECAAGLAGGVGHASYDLRAQTDVIATDRFLRVLRAGAFEWQFQGLGGRGITADISVASAEGNVATRVLYSFGGKPEPGCEFGLSVLGTFDSILPDVYIDLEAAGIAIGEPVTVSARLHVYAETAEPCQFVITTAILLVDEFEFCDSQPNPADIDRDGDVDEIDYALLVSVLLEQNFDPLYSVTSDVNGDGYADGIDVGPFVVAALTGD